MSNLLPISGADFRNKLAGLRLSNIDTNEKPKLFWIGIASLRVDHRYQRQIIGRTSEKNVLKIAIEFDWSKFAPVVVAELEDTEGLFAIIDGQHRTTAAALRGIRDVPCLIHKADLAAQANAFAAINGVVTAMSTMQLHHARVAAGHPAAVELHDVCVAAGVRILRNPLSFRAMKPGYTVAAGTLAQQLARYGSKTLVAALSCITKTGGGNIGMVRAPVVEALCAVFDIEPEWARDLDALARGNAVVRFPQGLFGCPPAGLAGARRRTGAAGRDDQRASGRCAGVGMKHVRPYTPLLLRWIKRAARHGSSAQQMADRFHQEVPFVIALCQLHGIAITGVARPDHVPGRVPATELSVIWVKIENYNLTRFEREAQKRGTTATLLASQILNIIAADDLFAATLDL